MGGMRELVRTMRRYCIAISATLTSSRTHLVQFIQQVITSGGNGFCLKAPNMYPILRISK
jgi:hypothetical protein